MSHSGNQIHQIRIDYAKAELSEHSVADNPVIQFSRWMDEALTARVPEPTAMAFGSVNEKGRPSVRIVLLKGFDEKGFVFFTNYLSRKGSEIAGNPWGALTFFWPELERQVRIEGSLTKVSAQESDEYFKSRPRESQIGAWVSPQSKEISGRDVIMANVESVMKRFEGKEVERPPHWGGYLLSPDHIEFWQGRPSRLHDRILYSLEPNKGWKKVRLAP